ncbi:DUF3027 domain-containing protein [Serinibacter arcticus]|uniref:DUF3027 domain-containing protein n=1 Tax=Serinibacter arcticus TaxID=1655435 RepID=A0A2U1ZYC8_9MICO|nr:DUF3027 domain-containing protein [Serinibacter arcticus]PWD51922.1 DUF3027 domain-containing protein [Serinibacter arcticus]
MTTPTADAPVRARRTTAKPRRDAVLAAAVEQAREAALETSGYDDVGEHLGYADDAERLGSHRFASTAPGYRGWHWTVTVARISRSKTVTICEVELLPGDDALLSPAWVPWAERLVPGDVGPNDVLPEGAVDDRVVPGYVPADGDPVDVARDAQAIIELGAWRQQVPSRQTLVDAATRWEDRLPAGGRSFATDPTAFIVPLSGVLGQVYGVCVNEFSPDDGKVVRLDQVGTVPVERGVIESVWPDNAPVIDEISLDTAALAEKAEPAPVAEAVEVTGAVDDETPADPVATDDVAATDEAPDQA